MGTFGTIFFIILTICGFLNKGLLLPGTSWTGGFLDGSWVVITSALWAMFFDTLIWIAYYVLNGVFSIIGGRR